MAAIESSNEIIAGFRGKTNVTIPAGLENTDEQLAKWPPLLTSRHNCCEKTATPKQHLKTPLRL